MDYSTTPEFDDQLLKLTRKNKALKARLFKKISQILDNPFIGDPKKHDLKHARGSYVDPYVIVYAVEGDIIAFLYVGHHDFVYGKASEIIKKYKI